MAELPDDDAIRAATVGELKPYATKVVIEDYNPEWPAWFAAEEASIRAALGPRALQIEHHGSTSVPDLAAKPIIDILLLVPDSADEPSYIPPLEKIGYTLYTREPNWYEHRGLNRRIETGAPYNVNLHVHSPDTGAPESSASSPSATGFAPTPPTVITTPKSNAPSPPATGNTSNTTPTPNQT